MRRLLSSSAIAAIVGSMAFAAHAQTSAEADGQMSAGVSFCDMQWSAVDGNDDAFITREEATGAIESEFDAIDADDNGEIGKTEYIDCKTQGLDVTSAEAERDEDSFASVDANQDKSIDREEFALSAEQAYGDSRSAGSADEEPLLTLRRFVWLTPEEASSGAMRDMSADEAAARAALTFDRLDENSDDIIDTQEWATTTTARGQTQAAAEAAFDEIDADASGAIGPEEYAEARSSGLDAMATGAVNGETSADAAGNEAAAVVPDVAADQEAEQARVGVPAFVFRLSDGDWE